MTERVPELLVERLRRGELPPAQAEDVRRRLAGEPGGEARLAALDADDAATLRSMPPERVAREVRARAADRGASQPSWRWAAPSMAVAAAVALAVVVGLPPRDLPSDELRTKGEAGAKLFVYRQGDGAPERLGDGAEVRGGDVLQLGYAAAGWSHGVVLSVDGRGAVTLHHPATQGGSTLLDGGGEILLGRAYRLDDAPAFETFALVVDDAPIDVAALLRQVRERGIAADPVGRDGGALSTSRFTVRKRP